MDELRARLDALRASPSASPAVTHEAVDHFLAHFPSSHGDDPLDSLSLPSVPSAPTLAPAWTKGLDDKLDSIDASLRTFTGPMTDIQFIPAPTTTNDDVHLSRTVREEEELMRRMNDDLLVTKATEKELQSRMNVLSATTTTEDVGPGTPPNEDDLDELRQIKRNST